MNILLNVVLILISMQACFQSVRSSRDGETTIEDEAWKSGDFLKHSDGEEWGGLIDTTGTMIRTRFLTPRGFERVKAAPNSFAAYLRGLPLKPHGATVKYYNGREKANRGVYDAVVDLPVGNKNLHQCADAAMRLWAEYLWKKKQYDRIHFNLTNGFRVDYSGWMEGKRIIVKGNETYWSRANRPASNTYEDFWDYLELIFTYAGTLSLSKELKPVPVIDMKIGDIFIVGGSPGHAVIVVDMAENPETKERVFLLAQSYMPAQEIQILHNSMNHNLSPWYPLDFGDVLQTPEWQFDNTQLKRFE